MRQMNSNVAATLVALSSLLVHVGAGPVSAATVLAVQTGSVLVDEGQGFAAVVGSKKLPPGARILLKAGSTASLADDTTNCKVPLPPERVLTVPATVPCTSKISTSAILDQKTQPPSYMSGHPEPEPVPSEPAQTEPAPSEPAPSGGIGAGTLAAGAGLAGAVGLAVLLSSKNSNKQSASP